MGMLSAIEVARENANCINASLEGIREEIRAARIYFFWTLGIIIGVLAPALIGLIVTLYIKL